MWLTLYNNFAPIYWKRLYNVDVFKSNVMLDAWDATNKTTIFILWKLWRQNIILLVGWQNNVPTFNEFENALQWTGVGPNGNRGDLAHRTVPMLPGDKKMLPGDKKMLKISVQLMR